MRNDPLRDALRRLPEEQASPGFTARVMARLDEPAAAAALAPRRALALAAAVVLTALAGSMVWRQLGPGAGSPEVPGPGPLTVAARPAGDGPALAAAATRPDGRRQRARQELAALLAEHRRLEQEWQDYRRLARQTEPVLYLDGNDNMDLVLDLRRVSPASLAVAAEPAAVRKGSEMP